MPVLNIEEGLKNQKKLFLSDIADSISYIKLETSPECLIGNGTAFIRKDKVFVSTIKPARVLVFDTQGKYLYKIDKQGQGPGEYTALFQFTISNSGKRMAFTDIATRDIFMFDGNGNYVNKTSSTWMWHSGMFFKNDNELIICTTEMLNQGPEFPVILSYSNDLALRDTILTKEWVGTETQPFAFMGNTLSFYRFKNKFYYKESTVDTLFELDKNFNFHPKYIFDVGTKGMSLDEAHSPDREAFYFMHSFYETKQYLSFVVTYKNEMILMAYDKSKGELFSMPENIGLYYGGEQVLEPINDLDGYDYPFIQSDIVNNMRLSIHQMVDLKSLESEGFFNKQIVKDSRSGIKLKALVKESQISDNPIIRILHMKK